MPSLAERLAALEAMSSAELKVEWRRLMREPPPPLSTELLMRGMAHRLQERTHGGLPSSARQHLSRLMKQVRVQGEVALEREVALKTGTRLARGWRGKTHHVLVLEEGFLFEDRHYTSLTRIAFAITGANWSGPRFFGLKRRPRAFARADHG